MKIKVTGVPEHFNLPWKLAIEEHLFPSDIEVLWQDEPSGTGALCSSLRKKNTDLAICLTEGIILDIEKENPSIILDVYVRSPLLWGIHTAADRRETRMEHFQKPVYAISKFGSGSNMMALLESRCREQVIDASQWKEVRSIEQAVQSLTEHKTDLFFWEKYMTMPYVEKNLLKRIGEFPTPWPCFVTVGREDFVKEHAKEVETVLNTVREQAKKLQTDPDLDKKVAYYYNISPEGAQMWSEGIQWNVDPVSVSDIDKIKFQVLGSMSS